MLVKMNSIRSVRTAALIALATAAVSICEAQNGPGGAPSGAPPKAVPYTLSGAYTLSGKNDKSTGIIYTSDAKDVSAIYVKSLGELTLTNPTITTTADSSSNDNSSFYGLNAAVLVAHGSKIKMTGGTVSTAGSGANGVFATGSSASISLSKTTVTVLGDGAHGVMATAGGSLLLTDVTITTSGARAAGIATDRGGGNITATGGTVTTSGDKSPAIYSTGNIKVTNATLTASGAEGAMIEGKNTITLTDTNLTGQKSRGVMIYQSMSGDASGGGSGSFSMTGGSLTAGDGPLFYVTNTSANIFISGVSLNGSSGTLLNADAGEWGKTGSNGGRAIFTADHETLNGDLNVGTSSSIAAKLQNNTTLNGAVKGAAVSIDSNSRWNVSSDSTVTVLLDSQGISGNLVRNITGNGHTVTYDSMLSGNQSLGGRTYRLSSGGNLVPTVKTNSNNDPNQNNNGVDNNNRGGNNQGNTSGGGGRGGRR